MNDPLYPFKLEDYQYDKLSQEEKRILVQRVTDKSVLRVKKEKIKNNKL